MGMGHLWVVMGVNVQRTGRPAVKSTDVVRCYVLAYIREKIRNEDTWITKNVGDDTTITRKAVTTHVAVHVSKEFPDIYDSKTAGLFAGRYAEVVVKKVKQLAVLAGIPADGVVKHAAKDGPEWADLLNQAKGTGFAWCKQIEPIVKHVLGMDSMFRSRRCTS